MLDNAGQKWQTMLYDYVVSGLDKGEQIAICDACWASASMEAQQLEEDNNIREKGFGVWRTKENFGEAIWERFVWLIRMWVRLQVKN